MTTPNPKPLNPEPLTIWELRCVCVYIYIYIYSLLRVVQDFYHQPYIGLVSLASPPGATFGKTAGASPGPKTQSLRGSLKDPIRFRV